VNPATEGVVRSPHPASSSARKPVRRALSRRSWTAGGSVSISRSSRKGRSGRATRWRIGAEAKGATLARLIEDR